MIGTETKAWRRLRIQQLRRAPFCQQCARRMLTTARHIGFKNGRLVSLCKACAIVLGAIRET